MASFNKFVGLGNVTRDPQLKYNTGGTAICELGIAINSSYTDKGGQKKEEVCFVDVTYFGKLAEVCGQYLTKGRQILIEGRLKLDTWEADGQKRSKLRVIGETMQMLGGPNGNGGSSGGQGNQNQNSGQGRPANVDGGSSAGDNPASDDVPF